MIATIFAAEARVEQHAHVPAAAGLREEREISAIREYVRGTRTRLCQQIARRRVCRRR
jgi:hypothetical protein